MWTAKSLKAFSEYEKIQSFKYGYKQVLQSKDGGIEEVLNHQTIIWNFYTPMMTAVWDCSVHRLYTLNGHAGVWGDRHIPETKPYGFYVYGL